MLLYLVQHAPARGKEEDPARGLSDEGIAVAERIAGVAAGYRVRVSRIVHSGKKRARQTAEIFGAALAPPQGIVAREGLDPHDDVKGFLETIAGEDEVMVIGHLPFLSRLASYLITDDPDQPVFLFQNGGIVCLTALPEAARWAIKWALMPNIGG